MRVGGVAVRVHPLFLVVMALAGIGGFWRDLVVLFSVVCLHELGHIAMARKIGYQTESVELFPFGGVAVLSSAGLGWNARDEAAIAVAGPAVNLFLALGAVVLHLAGAVPERGLYRFLTIDLSILFFNLLPGLPLDGGRIARAGLAGARGYEAATKAVTRMSFYLAAALMAFGSLSLWLGYPDAGLLGLGAFLVFSAYTLNRQTRYDTLRFLDAKRRDRRSDVLPMRALFARPEAAIGDVASRFAPGQYHVVYVESGPGVGAVRDGAGGSSGRAGSAGMSYTLEERLILEAIFERGLWTEPIRQLLP